MFTSTRIIRAGLVGAALLAVGAAAGAYAQATKPPAGGAPVAGPPTGTFSPNFGAAGAGATPAPEAKPPTPPALLAAALEVVTATGASKGLEGILPQVAQQVEARLTRERPDHVQDIGDAVDQTALSFAARRSEIDHDLAEVWAKYFTEAELKAITAFYRSPAGSKLSGAGPVINQESQQAANAWTNKLGTDLYEATKEALKKKGIQF